MKIHRPRFLWEVLITFLSFVYVLPFAASSPLVFFARTVISWEVYTHHLTPQKAALEIDVSFILRIKLQECRIEAGCISVDQLPEAKSTTLGSS